METKFKYSNYYIYQIHQWKYYYYVTLEKMEALIIKVISKHSNQIHMMIYEKKYFYILQIHFKN